MMGVIRTKQLVDDFIHKYGRLPTERDPDYLEMLNMTKYKVEDVPYFKPGKCANCGSSKNDGRRYINFGLEVDWYGVVYLCGTCLRDIANNAGLFEEQNLKIEELETELGCAQDLIKKGDNLPEKLINAWEEFKEYYASLQLASGNGPDSLPPSRHDNSIIQESNKAESDQSGIDSAESRTTKSTTSTRRKNLPSFTDLINDAK